MSYRDVSRLSPPECEAWATVRSFRGKRVRNRVFLMDEVGAECARVFFLATFVPEISVPHTDRYLIAAV